MCVIAYIPRILHCRGLTKEDKQQSPCPGADTLKSFSEGWRQFTDRYKKVRKDQPLEAIPPLPTTKGGTAPVAPKSGDRGVVPTPVIKPVPVKIGHNDLRFVLPPDISEHYCNDKFLEVVREAKTLDIGSHPYAALACLRMVFEFSVTTYMNRVEKGAELIDFALERRVAKGRPVKDRKSFNPKLEEVLAFLEQNPEIWGPLKQNHVNHSIKKLTSYVPTINSALHNPFQAIHRSLVFQIRDEAIHALRHLIEEPYPQA